MITVCTVKTVEMISEENREILCAGIIPACRGVEVWMMYSCYSGVAGVTGVTDEDVGDMGKKLCSRKWEGGVMTWYERRSVN